MFPRYSLITFLLIAIFAFTPACAEDADQVRLKQCMQQAIDAPDAALIEANKWMAKGGGAPAVLCRATAQFHRNEFIKAADDFLQLASHTKYEPNAAFLYEQAGLAYTRDKDYKKAEDAFAKALKLEQQDPELWTNRAAERAASQRYWEAIEDLDRAIKIMPDMQEALRLRGQVWFKLDVKAKAEADFRRASQIQAEEDVLKNKKPPTKVSHKK